MSGRFLTPLLGRRYVRLGKGLLMGFVALWVLIALGITFTIGWRPFIGPQRSCIN